ncbi:MAG: MerR family transcriptional regulator [Gammaproteobacteria bacterium]|nr:MerR family transcriptional regulator [Gammaproteobacteria bacterium]
MIVHELADHAGVPAHVVRYYSRIGLLKPNRNPDNGYKLFRKNDLHRLRFIQQAKNLGFTLTEINRLIEDAEQGQSICPSVRHILEQRIQQNQQAIKKLMELQKRMETALQEWGQMPDGSPDSHSFCPLIESELH